MGRLPVAVSTQSATPPFEQVRAQIAELAGTPALPVGSRLPPIRQLATELGLAAGTVARAYKELEAQGVVATQRRHGTVVLARGDAGLEQRRDRLRQAAAALAEVAVGLGVPETEVVTALQQALRDRRPGSRA